MQGFEPHHLSPRERIIVFTVLVLTLVGLTIWVGTIIFMLPDLSQGTFVPPTSLVDGLRFIL